MHSSISNSNTITRALLVCALALGLYEASIRAKLLAPGEGTNQWADNYIRAQRFVYETKAPGTVALVGSSLAANLRPEYFSIPLFNLGQSGGSCRTGLRLVERAAGKPGVVLVELGDTINRPEDTDLVTTLFSSPFYALRREAWMLRREYQPADVLFAYLKKRKTSSSSSADADREPAIDQSIRAKFVEINVQAQGDGLSAREAVTLRECAEKIQTQIATLEKQHVRVLLFHIPCDAQVEQTLRQKQIHTLLHEVFIAHEWLPEPEERAWTTKDGIHLTRPDAKYFATYITQYLQKNSMVQLTLRSHRTSFAAGEGQGRPTQQGLSKNGIF